MTLKKLLKTVLSVILIVIIGYLIHDNYYVITNKIEYLYVKYMQPKIRQNLVDNEYKINANYEYLKINKDTTISSKEDIKNAIYTFLDSGWSEYIVKCNPDYLTCVDDVKLMVEDNTYLTDISNFTHPFNTFEKINTSFTSTGKITFKKINRYSNDQIKALNEKVNEVYSKIYDKNKSTRDNIKAFHDYIINNTVYDQTNTTGTSDINSSTAIGVLFEGKGICSGYTDSMALFLYKMGIPNTRISSNTHVWNLVYVDGAWMHLDLTWDDPIMSDGSNTISYKYFLINTDTLKNQSDTEHFFNQKIYTEAQ